MGGKKLIFISGYGFYKCCTVLDKDSGYIKTSIYTNLKFPHTPVTDVSPQVTKAQKKKDSNGSKRKASVGANYTSDLCQYLPLS